MAERNRKGNMEVLALGTLKYEEALEIQEDLLKRRIDGEIPDTLILAEHEPVLTLGRISGEGNILNRTFFDDKGIRVVSTGRGGEVTYHAPGQLVVYPIVDLAAIKKDVSFYIDFLEKVTAEALTGLGVKAERVAGRRGVWAGDKKIAFIGIAVKKWVTYHGVAVNINNDITPFSMINPCGEPDIRVTSVKEDLGREIAMASVKRAFLEAFKASLEREKAEVGMCS